MADEAMTAARLELCATARVEVEAPDGSRHAGAMEQEGCRAPFVGPACFVVAIVLPKTARVTGGRAQVGGAGRPEARLNDVKVPRGRQNVFVLPPEAFAGGKDFDIPGLGFADFVRHELRIRLTPAEDRPAALLLCGEVEYLLPAPTAAAYLTYIMTQA